jgi:two-component system response regulator CpxR
MESALRPILLIDDDVDLCSLMREFFLAHDFSIDAVGNGRDGLMLALEGKFELVILDLMLPGLDGFDVLKELRKRSRIPVIILTARMDEGNRIAGLDGGADDYLPKPFGPYELLARVRAVLRRSDPAGLHGSGVVEVGALKLCTTSRELWYLQERIPITAVEFEILDFLMRSVGRIVSRDELASVLYHRASTPFERAIDVHISHLRKKLDNCDRISIRTIRGAGYLFALTRQE